MKKYLYLIGLLPMLSMADQVYNGHLIVQGNSCIGTDCTDGETFEASILKLAENNLRIHLQDNGSPTHEINLNGPDYTLTAILGNSWTLAGNDRTNGGDNYFAFEQAQSTLSTRLSDGTATDYTCYYTGTATPIFGEANKDNMDVTIVGTIPAGEPWEDQWCATRTEFLVRNGVRFTQGSSDTNGGVTLGFDSQNSNNTVSVGNPGKLRRLANLATALEDVDLLSVAQMDAYASQKSSLDKISAKLDKIDKAVSALENPGSNGGGLPVGLLLTLNLLFLRKLRR